MLLSGLRGSGRAHGALRLTHGRPGLPGDMGHQLGQRPANLTGGRHQRLRGPSACARGRWEPASSIAGR